MRITARKKFWEYFKSTKTIYGRTIKGSSDIIDLKGNRVFKTRSGLGIMGRKNDIKYQMTEEQLGELAALQRQILSVVWKYVKSGGQMIFSTCTLNKGENAENIKWIEENTPLHLVSIEEYLPQNLKNRTGSQGYLQLIPGEDTCDGFFISKFKRPEAK